MPEILNVNNDINSLHQKVFTKKETNLFGAINLLFLNKKASSLVPQKNKEISSKKTPICETSPKIVDHEISLTAPSNKISRKK